MMTDGVADMLPGMEHGLAGFMEQWQGRHPEEIADALLEEAICECGRQCAGRYECDRYGNQ